MRNIILVSPTVAFSMVKKILEFSFSQNILMRSVSVFYFLAYLLENLNVGIIHGDANDDNIVIQFEVDEDGESEYKLTGLRCW